ncbi:MAG: tetratricopeptide repeat protein [Planctomycetota bacterium]
MPAFRNLIAHPEFVASAPHRPVPERRPRRHATLFALLIALGWCVSLPAASGARRSRSAASQSDVATISERLDQIVENLASDRPNRRAAARRLLRDEIQAEHVDELRAYLGRPLPGPAVRTLGARLQSLIASILDETETDIEAFDAARTRVRDLVLQREQVERETPEDRASRDREIESLKREREELRGRLTTRYRELLRLGTALGPSLWRRIHEGGGVSPAIERFRDRLETDLVSSLKRTFPSAPDRRSVAPFERRALAPFIRGLLPEDPDGWAQFRDQLGDEAIAGFEQLSPGEVREARTTFLQLGNWGRERLDSWAESETETLPSTLRDRWAAWNRYAIPVSIPEQTALDIAEYETATPERRLALLYRLEWVGGTKIIPVFARILELEPELGLKVEAAAALARLADPRGLGFLRALGLEEVVAIETVSRRVLLLEAIHRREAGDTAGALEDLLALFERFPADHRLHYEIGFTALRLRDLPRAIDHFRRALEFRPDDRLAHYNLACAYALAGEASNAVASLRRAIQHGFRDPEHMQADEDLRSLRDNSDFQKLIESLQQ